MKNLLLDAKTIWQDIKDANNENIKKHLEWFHEFYNNENIDEDFMNKNITDNFIPFLFLVDPYSKYNYLLEKLDPKIQESIKENVQIMYEPICATQIEDFSQSIQDLSLRLKVRSVGMQDRDNFGVLSDNFLTYEEVYKSEFSLLSDEEKMLNEIKYRANIINSEMYFALLIAIQGLKDFVQFEIDELKDNSQKEYNKLKLKEIKKNIIAKNTKMDDLNLREQEAQHLYASVSQQIFDATIAKVNSVYAIIKQVMQDA